MRLLRRGKEGMGKGSSITESVRFRGSDVVVMTCSCDGVRRVTLAYELCGRKRLKRKRCLGLLDQYVTRGSRGCPNRVNMNYAGRS